MGDFLKFSVTNSRTDVAQIFGHLLGYFEKLCSQLKTYLASFWATFYYNMWSYCPFKPYLKQNFILFCPLAYSDLIIYNGLVQPLAVSVLVTYVQ